MICNDILSDWWVLEIYILLLLLFYVLDNFLFLVLHSMHSCTPRILLLWYVYCIMEFELAICYE